jgi:ribosomal peptide maturation radical SAM protein 1
MTNLRVIDLAYPRPAKASSITDAPARPDVALVTMPFGPLLLPSIGLSLLREMLARQGIATRIRYLTLAYSKLVGPNVYSQIANGKPTTCHLTGEWIFSSALFDQSQEQEQAYVEDILRAGVSPCNPEDDDRYPASDEFIDAVLAARAQVDGFLDYCTDVLLAERPRVVGFTSVFQQQVASLALARRLKKCAPAMTVVFGGANCEGIMGVEVLRQFDFVDAVVSGEGELAFPALISRILADEDYEGIPGVYTSKLVANLPPDVRRLTNARSVDHLDQLPYVAYDDFFAQAAELDTPVADDPQVLFETSRGCWWGTKHHCTFCGLNGAGMAFRSKTAERAIDELKTLCARHPGTRVQVVDNILDMRYFKDFIPWLAEEKLGVDLFYEVKANLSKEQLRALKSAGVTTIQPGLESLNTSVLTLMRKGVTAVQNVQLLKWCKELGVKPSWNLIWGFPDEDPAAYDAMAQLVPRLTHLPPPTAAAPVRLDRFSPLFDESAAFGFREVRPVPAYRHIYCDLPDASVHNLAYYFSYTCSRTRAVAEYTAEVSRAVAGWRDQFPCSDVLSVVAQDRLLIWDLRPDSPTPLTVLTGLMRSLYEECETYHRLQHLTELVNRACGPPVGQEEVERMLAPLVDRGLLMREADTYLNLSLPWGPYLPPFPVRARFEEVIDRLSADGGETHVVPISVIQEATIA